MDPHRSYGSTTTASRTSTTSSFAASSSSRCASNSFSSAFLRSCCSATFSCKVVLGDTACFRPTLEKSLLEAFELAPPPFHHISYILRISIRLMYPSLSPLYALFWAIDPCLPVIKLDPTHIKEHRVALFLVEPSPCHKAVEILI